MGLQEAVAEVLARRMHRVQIRAGNGLSRCMNNSLRSYAEVPRIIERTVHHLAGLEALFGYEGTVRIHTTDLYKGLMEVHDDWVIEVPKMRRNRSTDNVLAAWIPDLVVHEGEGMATGGLEFVRVPLLPLHQFAAAFTIARHIGLLHGRGDIGLSRVMLAEVRQCMASVNQDAS